MLFCTYGVLVHAHRVLVQYISNRWYRLLYAVSNLQYLSTYRCGHLRIICNKFIIYNEENYDRRSRYILQVAPYLSINYVTLYLYGTCIARCSYVCQYSMILIHCMSTMLRITNYVAIQFANQQM